MLEFFSLISFIFCVSLTIYAYKSEIPSILVINIVAFLVIGIMLGCSSSTLSICIGVIVTGIINTITLYILSEVQNVKNYEYNINDDFSSEIQIKYIKKLFKMKMVVVGFVVVCIIFLSAFWYMHLKLSDSRSLAGKYKDEINTYKSEIKKKNGQISTLEEENQDYYDIVIDQELDIGEKDAYIQDLERDIDLYERVTNNKKGFVFVTRTGKRFHLLSCHHLADSCYFRMYTEAIRQGYTPCSDCLPNGY